MIDQSLRYIWAKTSRDVDNRWHPLILHMLDVAASADAILNREPESTRRRMAAILGMTWNEAQPWILLLVACHDLGKACPGFQCKWPNVVASTELRLPRSPNTDINHAFVSQISLTDILQRLGWPQGSAELASDAVGCHHGERASEILLNDLSGDISAIGSGDWTQARQQIFEAVFAVLKPAGVPIKATFTGPDFMLLAGLTSFADWIGSNEDLFPFGTVNDCDDLQQWFDARRSRADTAMDAIGWEHRTPLTCQQKSFQQVFGFAPRPLQRAIADSLTELNQPAVLLVEAPMGEGKTEGAFYAHLELQRRFGHRGLYIALPTKATGNAMFERTLKFLRSQGTSRSLDLQLLHGGTLLNDTFQELRVSGIYDVTKGGEIRAKEWFTNKKRALLSEYGVGTVDQALLPILPVRHNFVRLWGLANRVVVFDEIHAYDAYTGTLLIHLVSWLIALGSSVILLSATLPPLIRRKLAEIVNADFPLQEVEYPRLTTFASKAMMQRHFDADPARRITLRLQGIAPILPAMYTSILQHLGKGGMALALVNTVQRAQDLYRLFPDGEPLWREAQRVGKRLADGTEVFLFHARFPANLRQQRESCALASFGQSSERSGRKILIATQVAEQSLDLDFDVIATDLAPIDLVLQRAGRLWRHSRPMRPVDKPILLVAGMDAKEPPMFGKPLWWGSIYREDVLLRTWVIMRNKKSLTLPDEIDTLVRAVYEEQVSIPEVGQSRLDRSMLAEEGEVIALTRQANQAIVGFPDDSSWNDPSRRVLYDEDEPGVHRTLMAQTRLGDDSVVAIPLWSGDCFDPETTPDFGMSKDWFLRAVNISRKSVVKKFQEAGVPKGWTKSALLRNCFPMILVERNCWERDNSVRLDDELGLVYETKESP